MFWMWMISTIVTVFTCGVLFTDICCNCDF